MKRWSSNMDHQRIEAAKAALDTLNGFERKVMAVYEEAWRDIHIIEAVRREDCTDYEWHRLRRLLVKARGQLNRLPTPEDMSSLRATILSLVMHR